MTVLRLLATVSIVALAVTVAAPATAAAKSASKAVATPSKTAKAVAPSSHRMGGRRMKRSVIVQVPVEVEDTEDEDAQLEDELSQLSDEQLAILADVVQRELDRYDPRANMEEYEIVDIPVEYLAPRGFARDRRSVLPIEDEEEVIFVPEEVLEEAMVEEALEEAAEMELAKELDEIELRTRIGEMAAILNERATRGSRR